MVVFSPARWWKIPIIIDLVNSPKIEVFDNMGKYLIIENVYMCNLNDLKTEIRSELRSKGSKVHEPVEIKTNQFFVNCIIISGRLVFWYRCTVRNPGWSKATSRQWWRTSAQNARVPSRTRERYCLNKQIDL